MAWQVNEKLAFRDSIILTDKLGSDTIPLKLSLMPEKIHTTKISFIPPGCFSVKASYDLDKVGILLNGQKVSADNIKHIDRDSLHLFAAVQTYSEVQFVLETETIKDTVTCKVSTKEKKTETQLIPAFKNGQIGPHEACSFQLNDIIQGIDTSKIRITDPLDSLNEIPVTVDYLLNELTLHFERKNYKDLIINLGQGAVTTSNNKTSSLLKQPISLKSAKNYGIIHANLESFKGKLIVELLQGSAVVKQIQVQQEKMIDFPNLLPGDYQFRIIQDENDNGIWDGGNIDLLIQPENVYLFSTPVTVRANWELNVNLSPTNSN
jgi:hypothetical protein